MRPIPLIAALLFSLPTQAGTSGVNGELKELPGLPIIDQVTLPIYAAAPDAAAASVWNAYRLDSSMPIHEIMVTRTAIPDKVSHAHKVIKGRRNALAASKNVLLPVGPMAYQAKDAGVALFQNQELDRFVVGEKSSLVCSKARPEGTYCVRLMNVGNLTAPVRGIRVPLEQIAKYNIGYASTDSLIGAVIARRTADKQYEENGAQIVNAVASKWVIFDPERGVVVSTNLDMDIRQPGQEKPAHWIKP